MKTMIDKPFCNSVEQSFGYLITDYGFTMKCKEESINHGFGIAYFDTVKCNVIVEVDRDGFSVKIKPAKYPKGIYINLNWIVEYFKGSANLPSVLFPLQEDSVAYLLQVYSQLFRIYCVDLLQGDFSWWNDLVLYMIEKMKDDYRATTGLDLPFAGYKRLQDYLEH